MRKLMRRAAVLEQLQISPSTLSRMLARGDLEVVRVGLRAIRIPAPAVEQFIRQRTLRRAARGARR